MNESLQEPVLITGATGFIGSRLVARLLADGYAPRTLVLPHEDVPESWAGKVDVRRGDVTNLESVEAAAQGAATLFHLAAVVTDWGPETLYERVTVDGTRHVLGAAAREGTRAVLASSIVVYGDHLARQPCGEDASWGRPLGPYSRHKQAQERLAWEIAEREDLRLAVVRPANVYGPRSMLWVHEVLRLLRRRDFTLLGDGEGCAALCYVENLVEVLLRAASLDAAVGGIYNAADGSDVTWRRYVSDLAALGSTPPPRSIPLGLARPLASILELLWRLARRQERPPITHEAVNLAGSDLKIPIEKARRELGYEPVTSYEEAMAAVGRAVVPKAP